MLKNDRVRYFESQKPPFLTMFPDDSAFFKFSNFALFGPFKFCLSWAIHKVFLGHFFHFLDKTLT